MTLKEKIQALKKEKNAVILAHYYQEPEIQEIADYVGDSLGLSQEAAKTNADIIACDDITITPELQSLFEQNSCNICEVSETGVTTTYEDGLHSAEISPVEVRWKNSLEPSTKVCADLEDKTEEEKEECRADQLIYENDQVEAQIISTYDYSLEPVDQNEFWTYGDDVLWLPYDGQNEFYLNPDDEILFKKTNNIRWGSACSFAADSRD